jgi:signal peptidase II
LLKKIYFFVSFAIVAFDQVSKYLVMKYIGLHQAIDVFPFFRLVHVMNKGAAFGSFQSLGNPFFVAVSFIAVAVVIFLMAASRENPLGLSMILGGAVGNLIDRLRFGHVVDFLDLYAGRYHWPAFNVADSFLSIGILLMLASYFLHSAKKK